MSIELIGEKPFNRGTCIKVIGVGGGGGNAVAHMIASGVQGVEFICANTDAQALSTIPAHRIIQLGTDGLGAGSDPTQGRSAAELAADDIRAAIDGAHMLFITAGMGGGTGTGAAPVIARIAREQGILTVGVVTKPFGYEGTPRQRDANNGVEELEAQVDSLVVVLNDNLQQVLGDDVLQSEAFAFANNVLKHAVGGLAEIINVKAVVNVDFADVRTVLKETGKAVMGTAVASGTDRAHLAADQAVACPLLEGLDIKGVKAMVVLITGSVGSLKLKDVQLAMETINAHTSPDVRSIVGTAYDETLGDQLRVTVIATGLSRVQPKLVVYPSPTQVSDVRPSVPAKPVVHIPVKPAVNPPSRGANTPNPWHKSREGLHSASPVSAVSSVRAEDFSVPTFLRKQMD